MEEKADEDDIPQLFGKNVQKYRKEMGLTQEQLSEKLKISQKHLSILENGTQFASASLIGRIATALNVSPAMLFGDSRNDINYDENPLPFHSSGPAPEEAQASRTGP